MRALIAHRRFFEQLAQSRSCKQREFLIKGASKNCIEALVEIVLNFLSSSLPLTHAQKSRLRPHAPAVRKFSRIRSEKRARAFLVQRGGFAPAILGPVLIALASGLLQTFFDDSHKQAGAGARENIREHAKTD